MTTLPTLRSALRHRPAQWAWFALDRAVQHALPQVPKALWDRLLVPPSHVRVDRALLQTWGRHPGARLLAPPWRPSVHGDPRTGTYRAAGIERRFDPRTIPWDAPGGSALFDEELCYLDAACAWAATCQGPRVRAFLLPLLRDVLSRTQPGSGRALTPYATASRLLNVLRTWALFAADGLHADDPLDAAFARLAWRDCVVLGARPERHNRANHLLRELVALRVAEPVLGLRGTDHALEAAVAEQLLPDGGHVERSPAYLLRVLRDLAELVAARPELADGLRAPLTRGLDLLDDIGVAGGLPLFGDGGSEQLWTVAALREVLGATGSDSAGRSYSDFGVHVLRAAQGKVVLRAGPSPRGTDAHVHADQGAIAWEVHGVRVLDGLGTASYEEGSARAASRGVAAHCTVQLDDREPAELLGAFRVGRRAEGSARRDGAALDAIVTWPGGRVHHRRLQLDDGGETLVVHDHTRGANEATARFHVPGGIDAANDHGDLVIRHPAGRLRVRSTGATSAASRWHPRIGESSGAVTVTVPLRQEGARHAAVTRLVWENSQ